MHEQNTVLTSGQSGEYSEFWKKTFDLCEGDFHLRQNGRSYAAADAKPVEYELTVDETTARFIDELAHGKDVGVFVIVMAGVAQLLRIYTGSQTVLLDSPLLQTVAAEGCDIDVVPLVTEIENDRPVRAHLEHVRSAVSESYTCQDFPIEAVAKILLHRKARPSTNVLVRFPAIHRTTSASESYDLVIEIRRDPVLRVRLLAQRPGLFSTPYLAQFSRHLGNILSAYRQLDLRLGDVPVIDGAERAKLLSEYNGPTQTLSGDATALSLFREKAAQSPGSAAIVTTEKQLSYQQLDECSNRLAHFLQDEYQLQPGEVVAVLSDRSELWVIALLGILKARGVYLPVDPGYPEERIRFMVEDAGARVLLVHSEYLPRLTAFYATPMFALDFQLDALETPATAPTVAPRPEETAYIIYTSGSTGRPKGVVLDHGGLLNMLRHHIDAFGIDASDRLSQFYAPSFDSSLFEVFVALGSGATLVVASLETIKDPAQFSESIRLHAVTTVTAPPVYLGALDRAKLGSVKRIISAGDNAKVEDARDFAKTIAYYNSYGPTETTVCVTHYRVDPAVAYGSRIPIGRPIHNTSIYILDDDLKLLPEGCAGEICIGGAGLARGYLHRDDLTSSAFVANPFLPGARLYCSGDLGAWLPDGNLELIGRKDQQVKIRGYRVELGEIEAMLIQHQSVKEAVVVPREEQPGDQRLVAYVSLAAASTGSELRDYLKTRLPEFMLPSTFVVLDELPRTANGKVDRKSLPDPRSEPGRASTYAPPENRIQERLSHIWKELLGLPQVGIHDNFFELGGDSILIILAVSRASQAGIKLTAQQMFERQTVAQLAEVALEAGASNIDRGPVTGAAKLAPMQRWFFSQPSIARHHYNQSVMLEVPAKLETEVVRAALASLMQHHDALRLRFTERDGQWLQWHAPEGDEIPFGITVSDNPTAIVEQAAELQASLDLAAGPLLRVHLFRSAQDRPSQLLFILHHLVVDGVSWRILFEDLATACRQISDGQAANLPAKTSSFQTWTSRLEDLSQTDFEGLHYWLDERGWEAPPLPVDRAVAAEMNTVSTAAEVTSLLDEEQTRSLLQETPRAFHAQLDDILLTALLLAVREWTGQSRLIVDLEGHGREDLFEDLDLSRTVGWFTALYPVRLEASQQASPRHTLQSLKEQLRAVPLHGLGYGLARYLREDQGVRDQLSLRQPAEILFNYLGQTDRVLATDADWKPLLGFKSPQQSASNRRSHLIEITAIVFEGRLRLEWIYSRNMHEREVIERLAERYTAILLSLIECGRSPDARAFNPADFPAARIDQATLDALVAQVGN